MARSKIEATADKFTAEVMEDEKTVEKETEVENAMEKKPPKKEPEKTVRFKLFKDGGKYKGDKFVGVNGKGYLVERGVWVDLPESVYNVLALSEEQIQVAERVMEESRMVEYK